MSGLCKDAILDTHLEPDSLASTSTMSLHFNIVFAHPQKETLQSSAIPGSTFVQLPANVVTQVLVGICHNTHPIYQSLGVWGAAIDTRLCHSLDPRHMPIHYEILDAQGDRCLVSWTNLRSNIKQEQKSSKSKKDVGGVQKASFFENMGVAEVPRCCTPIHRAALGAVLDPRPVHSAVAGF